MDEWTVVVEEKGAAEAESSRGVECVQQGRGSRQSEARAHITGGQQISLLLLPTFGLQEIDSHRAPAQGEAARDRLPLAARQSQGSRQAILTASCLSTIGHVEVLVPIEGYPLCERASPRLHRAASHGGSRRAHTERYDLGLPPWGLKMRGCCGRKKVSSASRMVAFLSFLSHLLQGRGECKHRRLEASISTKSDLRAQ